MDFRSFWLCMSKLWGNKGREWNEHFWEAVHDTTKAETKIIALQLWRLRRGWERMKELTELSDWFSGQKRRWNFKITKITRLEEIRKFDRTQGFCTDGVRNWHTIFGSSLPLCVCMCVCVYELLSGLFTTPYPINCSLWYTSVHDLNSPGKNTGIGCHSFLQGIFPTQGSNPGLSCCRQILSHLNNQRSPFGHVCECVSHSLMSYSLQPLGL